MIESGGPGTVPSSWACTWASGLISVRSCKAAELKKVIIMLFFSALQARLE